MLEPSLGTRRVCVITRENVARPAAGRGQPSTQTRNKVLAAPPLTR